MFTIDTGSDGGSLGPWLSWSSNGSAEKGFAPRTWVLRGKDDNGNKNETVVPAFASGCVMDLDSLKLGWEKDGAAGQAPERRWNPSPSQQMPRPDESKKPGTNSFCWSRALSVRVAIGPDQAANWEQGSWAAYEGFSRLAKQIMAEWQANSQNGKLLPVVVQTGVEKVSLKSGTANVPVFSIAKWVPRPACLTDDAPKIDAGDHGPAATMAPPPTSTPAPAGAGW